MKYETTSTHPELKEGIEIEMSVSNRYFMFFNSEQWFIAEGSIKNQIEKGYIKEVEEKEFTKSDMINFCLNYCQTAGIVNEKNIKKLLNEWLK